MPYAIGKFGRSLVLLVLGSLFLSGCGGYRLPDTRGSQPPSEPSTEQRQTQEPESIPGTVIVRNGDSLYKIAQRHSVSLRVLIDVNKIPAPYVIYPGQRLKLPGSSGYIVRKGDNIYGIARTHGISPGELVRTNQLSPPYRLTEGQRLIIPKRGPVVAAGGGSTPKKVTFSGVRADKVSKPSTGTKNTWRKPAPAKLNSPPPRSRRDFLWPVRGRVLVGFGPRKGGLHNDGINIGAPAGTRIRAAENGVVAYSGNQLRGFGNLVLIKHENGWMTAYAHASIRLVQRGDKVRRGQVIGRVGRTGSVAKPQLHFELRRNNEPVDPRSYLVRTARRNGLSVERLSLLSRDILNKLPGDPS